MKKLILNTGIVTCLLLAFACSKRPGLNSSLIDVYVSGSTKTTGDRDIIKYWKNGIPVNCTDGTKVAYVNSMDVAGSDVYVTGIAYNGNLAPTIVWKNGKGVPLNDVNSERGVYSVKAYGSDVYYGGAIMKGSSSIATYWKNGVPVSVSDGLKESAVTDIALSGSDLYLLVQQSTNPSIENIWKNGALTTLPLVSGSKGTWFGNMAVNNNDVYVATSVYTTKGFTIAGYFKNNIYTSLSDSTSRSYCESICVDGKDVYVAGSSSDKGAATQGFNRATYWKNGTAIYLTNGAFTATASSITVVGSDVYVAGTESNGVVNVGKYWKNGKPVILTDGTRDAYIIKIVVVQH